MSLPPDITTITITGSYRLIDGTLLSGQVIWDPGQVIKDATGKVILGGPVGAVVTSGTMLAASGGPLVLPHNDSAGLNPQGFAYTVTTAVQGISGPPAQYLLPTALGATVDMSALVEVDPPPPYSTVYGVLAQANTWTGSNTFADPLKVPEVTQNFTAASTVTVVHDLGRRPAVTVIDTADDVCVGDVKYLDSNTVQLSFSAPFSGTAICT
jgi:hypothetical protein